MNAKATFGSQRAAAKKKLAVYLVVTFALTWALDFAVCFALGAFENGELATPAITVPITVSMFFPLAGALVANRVCSPEYRIDLGFHPRLKGNVRFYLIAWFGPAVITAIGCAVFFALNPHLFDPTGSSYLETLKASMGAAAGTLPSDQEFADTMPAILGASVVAALTIAPFINMIPALGEEVGWRGLLFPTLCELMPTRAAVVVSGVIWGLWHAPIIAIGHNYGMDYPGFPWAGIVVMTVACTAMGSCLAYLRMRTGSVWPCALAHGALNAAANIGLVFCAAGQMLAGPSPLGYIAGIPLLALGVACWLGMRTAPLLSDIDAPTGD